MKAMWTEASNGKMVVVVGITREDFDRMLIGGAPVAPHPEQGFDVVIVARPTEDGLTEWMKNAGCRVIGCGHPDPHLN